MKKILSFIYILCFISLLPNTVWSDVHYDIPALKTMAESGNASAQNDLGAVYKFGHGVPVDYSEAMKWFRKAADQGDDVAQYHIGTLFEYGLGVPKDYDEAKKWYQKAADKGLVRAQYQLGARYYLQSKEQKDDHMAADEAAKWLLKAASQDDAPAQFRLGIIYRFGNGGSIKQDLTESARWYQKAADLRYSQAMVNLSAMYDGGYGVSVNHKKADELLLQAAEDNNAAALYGLGVRYETGGGDTKMDKGESIKWLLKAAEQKNKYFQDDSTSHDEIGALEVRYNMSELQKIAFEANSRVDLWADFELGKIYKGGYGGCVSCGDEAENWYRKAAEHGLVTAQLELSLSAKDKEEAYFWACVSARLSKDGTKNAVLTKNSLHLTQEEMAKAQAKANEWKPKTNE